MALLQAVAAMATKPDRGPLDNRQRATHQRLDVGRWLTDRGVGYRVKDQPDDHGRTVYLLAACPFDAAHGNGGEVAIYAGARTASLRGVQT